MFVLENIYLKHFEKDYPLVLNNKKLGNEVPYLGGNAELVFYVEGLRFPDKDFDGLINIYLSLLEPIAVVSAHIEPFKIYTACPVRYYTLIFSSLGNSRDADFHW